MAGGTIVQSVFFRAKPGDVFSALMDSAKHSEFTNSKCSIGKKAGDGFSAYDGYATGKNIEIVQNKKIVQSWRASDWPEGVFSEVKFILKSGKGGTLLSFSQEGMPEGVSGEIAKGWKDFYWQPLAEYLKKKR
ncbi:Activator of Hsp90 ATPase -like protein [uncultured archaeon]|nr:Activator of Hsp90 ATPase -like protein [uncultured archaeon]